MKLNELAQRGITRFRRPMWADQKAYAKITIVNGMVVPWLSLYERGTQNAIGEPTPQKTLCIGDETNDYVEYTGERDPEDSLQ